MGLLDAFNSEQGRFGLGLLAASAPRSDGAGFGQRLNEAVGSVDAWKQSQAKQKQAEFLQKVEQMKMDELKRKLAQDETDRSAVMGAFGPTTALGALSGGGGPTQANADKIGSQQAFDPRQFMANNRGVSMDALKQYMDVGSALKPKMTAYKPGDVIFKDGDMSKPMYSVPEKPDKPAALPSDIQEYQFAQKQDYKGSFLDFQLAKKSAALPSSIQEYQFAKGQGYKGTFEQWDTARKKAGASSVTVNAEKPLLNSVATGLGKQLDDGLASAKSAVASIGTAQRLMSAVDSGKLVSGPGATFRVLGLQVGQMLGVGGNDGKEILANTRNAIQAMAQAELDAAQQMKGQGQITEAERSIIRRAASGDINDLTAPEIKQLAQVMEKTSRYKLSSHKSNVDALGKMPGASSLMPFYQVPEPSAYNPKGAGTVRKYNPATGKIE